MFLTAFAQPLPFAVIADVLGVTTDRHGWLSEAMETFGQAVAGQRDHANVERGNAAVADMLDYFDRTLAERAGHPQEDVLSLLAAEPLTRKRVLMCWPTASSSSWPGT